MKDDSRQPTGSVKRLDRLGRGRQYSHTWRLAQAGGTGPRLAFDLGGLRRETSSGATPQHELPLRAGWQLTPFGGLDLSAQLEGAWAATAATADTPAHRLGLSLTGTWSGFGATRQR